MPTAAVAYQCLPLHVLRNGFCCSVSVYEISTIFFSSNICAYLLLNRRLWIYSNWLFVSFGVCRNFWGCVRGWKKSNRKYRTKKEKFAECIHFRGIDSCKSKCKRDGVCCLWKSQWKAFGVLKNLKLTISRSPVSRRGHHFNERGYCSLSCYVEKKGNTGMRTRILMSFKKFNDCQKDSPCAVSHTWKKKQLQMIEPELNI